MAAIDQVVQPIIVGGNRPNYKIHIVCAKRGLNLAADIPEQFSLAMQSEWENRFGTNTLLGIQGLETLARFGGANLMAQYLTKQIWTSSSPLEIPLQIIFDAETSAYDEVYLPMTKLLELTVPIKNGEFMLTPPGPFVGNMDYAVTVRIGKLLFIPDGIATSVQAQFDTRLDSAGFPISGQIDMTVRTSLVYSNIEWNEAIRRGIQGV